MQFTKLSILYCPDWLCNGLLIMVYLLCYHQLGVVSSLKFFFALAHRTGQTENIA
ncbi:MAG TPA: hypothetical protein P5239_02545 [Victivallales bacterium]|nr:hypothetical protein [Victivallales bacterium]